MFVALFIVACGGGTYSPSEIPSLAGTETSQPADKEVGLVGPGSGGGGGGGPLGGRDWPEPGEDAGPLEPQSPLDDGEPHSIGPWGPVVETIEVELEGGGTTTVARLSSSDPFTGFYQLEDGTLVTTNRDLCDMVNAIIEPDPPIIEWIGPDGEPLNIFDGEIIIYFLESATQNDIELVIVDHNLHVIMSWFEPPDEGLLGNALAWFQFEYDQQEFPTFDDAFDYFSSHALVDQALPNQSDTWENAYTGETDPADYYYQQNENSYINVLEVDSSQRVPLGPTGGTWFSDQYIVVIDDGVWRYHPEFWVATWPYAWWGKITWVGANVDHYNISVGYWYGGPERWNPNRQTLVTHGTQVAGMLTATTDDTRGVAASAPRHAVLPIRMRGHFNASRNRMMYSETVMVKAVRALRFNFAHNQWIGRFRVVNMSFSGTRFAGWWGSRNFKKNINRDLWRNDRLYVAAAGNEHWNTRRYPAAFDNVLGVTGLITNRTGTWFDDYYWGCGSNYRSDGYATYPVSGIFDFHEYIRYGWWVGRTTSIGDYPFEHNDLWYQHFGGTSAATPNVAGLGAMLYQRRKWTNYHSVWNRIVSTRDDSKARGYVAGLVDYDAALAWDW